MAEVGLTPFDDSAGRGTAFGIFDMASGSVVADFLGIFPRGGLWLLLKNVIGWLDKFFSWV